MANQTAGTTAGLSIPSVVFIVFLTLKLAKVITWSWWWVTSPLWLMAIVILLSIIVTVCFLIAERR